MCAHWRRSLLTGTPASFSLHSLSAKTLPSSTSFTSVPHLSSHTHTTVSASLSDSLVSVSLDLSLFFFPTCTHARTHKLRRTKKLTCNVRFSSIACIITFLLLSIPAATKCTCSLPFHFSRKLGQTSAKSPTWKQSFLADNICDNNQTIANVCASLTHTLTRTHASTHARTHTHTHKRRCQVQVFLFFPSSSSSFM